MAAAATRADGLGQTELAERLRKEVSDFRDGQTSSRAELYRYIEDAVLESARMPSFRNVVRYVAYEGGMTQREFLETFPKARTLYDKAKRAKKRWLKRREHLRCRSALALDARP
jgi:hypothetical protein